PLLLPFMIRRVGSDGSPEALGLLVGELAAAKMPARQLLYLRGIQEGLVGRPRVAMPRGWAAVSAKLDASPDAEVRTRARSLAVTFGDPAALVRMRDLLARPQPALDQRKEALATLLAARDRELVPVLHGLLREPDLRGAALRGL